MTIPRTWRAAAGMVAVLACADRAGAASPAAALDSLDLAAGIHRTGLYAGSSAALAEAGRLRAHALGILDSLTVPPVSLDGVDWPTRSRWLDRALLERRADWSRALVLAHAPGGDLRLPDPGSPTRGPCALRLGLNALAARDAGSAGKAGDARPAGDAGEPAGLDDLAQRAFLVAAEQPFLLRDEAFYRLHERAVGESDTAAALRWADSLAVHTPRSARTPGIRVTRVEALLRAGDPAGALEEARLALPDGDSPRLRTRVIEANLEMGFDRTAAQDLVGLIGAFGSSPEAWSAYERRLELAAADRELALGFGERLSLLAAMLGGPHRDAAADSILAIAEAAPPMAGDALMKLGRRFYAARSYTSAEPLLRSVVDRELAGTDEARLLLARIHRNTGRVETMTAHYRALIAGGGPRADDAVWELARELESQVRWSEAESVYTELLGDFPRHGRRRDARFRRGFVRYRAGDLDGAAADFRELLRSDTGSEEEQAAYWLGRTLRDLGRAEEAVEIERAGLASPLPHGSYGVLLRDEAGVPAPASDPPPAPPVAPGEDLVDHGARAGWPEPVETAYRRGIAFAAMGEFDLARNAWAHAARFGGETEGLLPALAFAAATFGVYPEGVTWGRRVAQSLPAGDSRRLGYERLGYPAAFYDSVVDHSDRNRIDPWMMWSIMRQESLYDPRAVSRAGAFGLLQIMPATLDRMVQAGHHPRVPPRALFRPEVNIELGTRFFVERLEEFGGRLLPALASYNAGERKSWEWLDRAGGDSGAVFLECVGYPETYSYLRRVVWIAWMYRAYYPPGASSDGGEAGAR